MKSILHTQRLVLRELGAEEGEAVLLFLEQNRDFLQKWEPQRAKHYYTVEFQQRLLQQESIDIQAGQMFKWWLYAAAEPERIIGSVSLSNIVHGAFQSCHLGYRIDEREQNKGYMTEAVRRVAKYAFAELGLHRIEANIMPRNGASLKVTEKCGFYHEGLALKYLKINGVWEDHIHMVLRNERLE